MTLEPDICHADNCYEPIDPGTEHYATVNGSNWPFHDTCCPDCTRAAAGTLGLVEWFDKYRQGEGRALTADDIAQFTGDR